MADKRDSTNLEDAWQRGEVAPLPDDGEPAYISPRRRRLVVKPHFWFLVAAAAGFFIWDGRDDLAYWLQAAQPSEVRSAADARDGLYATVGGTMGPRRAQYGDREVLVLLHTPFLVDREAARKSAASPVLPAYHGSGRLISIGSAGAALREAREQLAAAGDVPADGEVWVLVDGEAPRTGLGAPLFFGFLALVAGGGIALGVRGFLRPPAGPSRAVRFGGAPFAAALLAFAALGGGCPRQNGGGDGGPGDTGAGDSGGGDAGGVHDPGGPALARVTARAGWKSRAAVSGPHVLYRVEITQTSQQLFLVDTGVTGGAEVAVFPGESTDPALALDGRVAYAAVAPTFTTREIARWDAATSARTQVQAPTGELVFDLRARNGACAWRQGPIGGSQSLRLWTQSSGVHAVAEDVLAIDNLWLTDTHLVWAFKKDSKDWIGAAAYSAAGAGARAADVQQSAHFMRGAMPFGADIVFYMWTGCAMAPDCPVDLARLPIGGGERTVINNALPEPEAGAFAVAAGRLVFIDHSPLRASDPYAVRWVALGAGTEAPKTLVAAAPRKIEGMATDGRRVVFVDWANDPDGQWIYNDAENDPALYISDAEALQ